MKFCDDNPNCGIWYTIAETTSQFTFANSESTKCKQKLIALKTTERKDFKSRFAKKARSDLIA